MKLTYSSGRRQVTAGFSLLELMIAVAIIGILAAIAMPAYVSHIARGKRAEVKGALQENAQFLESYYTTRGFYSTTKGSNQAPTLPVTQVPRSGTANYTITATVTNTSYTLTAKAVNSMVKDGCGNFTLKHTGTQGVSGELGAAECWNR